MTEKLESAGVLNELRARIRAELLSAMEGKVKLATRTVTIAKQHEEANRDID